MDDGAIWLSYLYLFFYFSEMSPIETNVRDIILSAVSKCPDDIVDYMVGMLKVFRFAPINTTEQASQHCLHTNWFQATRNM